MQTNIFVRKSYILSPTFMMLLVAVLCFFFFVASVLTAASNKEVAKRQYAQACYRYVYLPDNPTPIVLFSNYGFGIGYGSNVKSDIVNKFANIFPQTNLIFLTYYPSGEYIADTAQVAVSTTYYPPDVSLNAEYNLIVFTGLPAPNDVFLYGATPGMTFTNLYLRLFGSILNNYKITFYFFDTPGIYYYTGSFVCSPYCPTGTLVSVAPNFKFFPVLLLTANPI